MASTNKHFPTPAHTGIQPRIYAHVEMEPQHLFSKNCMDSYPRKFKLSEIKVLYGSHILGLDCNLRQTVGINKNTTHKVYIIICA